MRQGPTTRVQRVLLGVTLLVGTLVASVGTAGAVSAGQFCSTSQAGQTVTADDAYLLESILDPDKQIVKGFKKGIMSATIAPGSVSAAKAKALVAFIKSKK